VRSFEFSTHHTMARKPPSEAAVRALVPAPHGFVCALCHAASTGVPDTGFPLTDAGDDACAKLALFEAGAVVADDPDDAAEARAEDGQ